MTQGHQPSLPVNFLPTREQTLLLQAINADDADLPGKLKEWEDRVDFETLELGSIRLLPMLAARLEGTSSENPLLGRYRGIQRQSWAKNQQLLKAMKDAAEVLGKAGVRVMALKGGVLASHYYENSSLRPMSDIDLLVEQNNLAKATQALAKAGWSFEDDRQSGDSAAMAFQPAIAMKSPGLGLELDLHGRLFSKRFSRQAEADLWRDSVPLEGFAPMLRPGDSDMLLHICAHGARFNTVPPVRWIPDAMRVIARGGVDWDHVQLQARRWGIAFQLGFCLDFIASNFGCEIPAEARRVPPPEAMSSYERRAYLIDQKPSSQYSMMDSLAEHNHVARHMGRLSGPLGYSRYWLWRMSQLDGRYMLSRARELLGNSMDRR